MADMKNVIRFTVLITFFSIFFGCAYMPDNGISKAIVNQERLKKVNTIALLDVANPSKYWMGDPHSGVAAGLFGPILSLGTANHEKNDIFRRLKFSTTATEDLRAALKKEGFKVILLNAKRPEGAKSKLFNDYSTVMNINADAILDVAPIHIGYREKIGEMHFSKGALSPDVSVEFRLVSTSDKKIIVDSNVHFSSFDYRESHLGSWGGPILVGPADHIFKDKESVERNPDEALRRMKYAVNKVAEFIASFLALKEKVGREGK
jgi:hypothetical protein